ncbi:putative nucleotidyltransferase [Aequorivita sublithincola DSM 14238]|uniref:Putative nucleotidyltransferase n=1 Tax=Aequorivita sublithincola (strain DSM 14238 / LMG 21431 / ACAM 643 / 9-3) TaxID=746697 RepID=I3YUY0_AEQSU|nr:nucleotidyltransferase domain-containing protein [Aequorivita sublithincola]AFL80798.1 putative nucleotidyltransferase [Aequorivita sublithincola DSM 14238]
MENIEKHTDAIKNLCEKHKVATMYLFGSAIRGNYHKDSDVDFLVRFKKFDLAGYFENYMSFKEELGKLLNREIDLVEEQTLKNPVLIESIENSKQLIYG